MPSPVENETSDTFVPFTPLLLPFNISFTTLFTHLPF